MGTSRKRLKKKRLGEAGGARCRRPGRGAFGQRGAAAGGGGRAERGPGRRPATKEHPQPRGAGGAERDQREPDFARRAGRRRRQGRRARDEAVGRWVQRHGRPKAAIREITTINRRRDARLPNHHTPKPTCQLTHAGARSLRRRIGGWKACDPNALSELNEVLNAVQVRFWRLFDVATTQVCDSSPYPISLGRRLHLE